MSEQNTIYTVPIWVLLDLAQIRDSAMTNIRDRKTVMSLAAGAVEDWLAEHQDQYVDALNEMGRFVTSNPNWQNEYYEIDYSLNPPAVPNATDAPASPPAPESGAGEVHNAKDALAWFKANVSNEQVREALSRMTTDYAVLAGNLRDLFFGEPNTVGEPVDAIAGKVKAERDNLQRQLADTRMQAETANRLIDQMREDEGRLQRQLDNRLLEWRKAIGLLGFLVDQTGAILQDDHPELLNDNTREAFRDAHKYITNAKWSMDDGLVSPAVDPASPPAPESGAAGEWVGDKYYPAGVQTTFEQLVWERDNLQRQLAEARAEVARLREALRDTIDVSHRLLLNHAVMVNHNFLGGLHPLPLPDEEVTLDLRLQVIEILNKADDICDGTHSPPAVAALMAAYNDLQRAERELKDLDMMDAPVNSQRTRERVFKADRELVNAAAALAKVKGEG